MKNLDPSCSQVDCLVCWLRGELFYTSLPLCYYFYLLCSRKRSHHVVDALTSTALPTTITLVTTSANFPLYHPSTHLNCNCLYHHNPPGKGAVTSQPRLPPPPSPQPLPPPTPPLSLTSNTVTAAQPTTTSISAMILAPSRRRNHHCWC